MLLVDHPREMGEDVDVAGDAELAPELLPCALVFGIGETGSLHGAGCGVRFLQPLTLGVVDDLTGSHVPTQGHGAPALVVWGGTVTRTPSPLPVREGLVYQVSNHEVMDCPEHQIRLSKRVIAKFVQTLGLGARKSHRDGGLCVPVF